MMVKHKKIYPMKTYSSLALYNVKIKHKESINHNNVVTSLSFRKRKKMTINQLTKKTKREITCHKHNLIYSLKTLKDKMINKMRRKTTTELIKTLMMSIQMTMMTAITKHYSTYNKVTLYKLIKNKDENTKKRSNKN